MTCRELTELLLDYVAGELSDEQRFRFDEHLRHCSTCLVYLETYQLTIQISRRLPSCEPLPEEVIRRLRSALEA